MCARPRKASDAEIFAAAGRTMARLGPAQITLAAIAADAGLTPGALVQRFGSKRELLLAVSADAARGVQASFAGLRARHRSPLAALGAYADFMAGMGASPGVVAHQLAYFQVDLTDRDFHQHTLTMARATQAALVALLRGAVDAGELRRQTDLAALARSIQAMLGGSLMSWAVLREGTASDWITADLALLVGAWLTPRGRRAWIRSRRPTAPGPRRPTTTPRSRRRPTG